MSANFEQLLKAAGHVPETKPTLEVSPHHPLVRALKHEMAGSGKRIWTPGN